jgi:hypothetical protein
MAPMRIDDAGAAVTASEATAATAAVTREAPMTRSPPTAAVAAVAASATEIRDLGAAAEGHCQNHTVHVAPPSKGEANPRENLQANDCLPRVRSVELFSDAIRDIAGAGRRSILLKPSS